ncbi:MAG: MotA/TolQ/ExbB proton channel family protein [Acidobacteriota bacterium]
MQFGLLEMWQQMGALAKGVVFILLFLSIWTFTVGIEKIITYTKARKQSRKLAPQLAKLLKEGKTKDAITLAIDKKNKNSHLAKVVAAGLEEFMYQLETTNKVEEKIESSKRAIERATLIGVQDFKKGLNALATIGSTAPFVGLFGTVFGIINAFHGMAITGSGGIGAVAAGIAEALVTTGTGIGVAVIAVWFYNFFLNQIEVFSAEMANSSSELVGFFIQKTGA